MDLQSEWNNMSEAFTTHVTSPAIDKDAVQKESKGVYETLRKGLGYKLMWIRIISVPMLAGAYFAEGGLRYVLIGTFFVYELSHLLMMRKLRHMPPELDYSQATKTMLSRQLQLVKEILKAERIWGYIFIPLSAPVGLIAYQLFSRKDISALYSGPYALLYLAIVIVFTFLGLIMAEKMNNIAFSKHIRKLTENVEQMN